MKNKCESMVFGVAEWSGLGGWFPSRPAANHPNNADQLTIQTGAKQNKTLSQSVSHYCGAAAGPDVCHRVSVV